MPCCGSDKMSQLCLIFYWNNRILLIIWYKLLSLAHLFAHTQDQIHYLSIKHNIWAVAFVCSSVPCMVLSVSPKDHIYYIYSLNHTHLLTMVFTSVLLSIFRRPSKTCIGQYMPWLFWQTVRTMSTLPFLEHCSSHTFCTLVYFMKKHITVGLLDQS